MGRPKVYAISLTDDERSKLNKVIKNKTTCKTVLKRCQILRDLDETKGCGLTHAQIAHTYAFCPATISNIIRDYAKKVLTVSSDIISAQTQQRPCVRQMAAQRQS